MIPLLLFLALTASAVALFRGALRLRIEEAFFAAALTVLVEGVLVVCAFGWMRGLHPGPVLGASLALLAAHFLGALLLQGAKPPRGGAALLRIYFPPVLWPAAALVGVGFALRLWVAWKTPADSWDGLTYHLPIIYRWLSQGDFSLEGWMGFQRYLAFNGELLSAWFALLDGGRIDAVKVAQAAALPLLAASGAVLGRRLAGPLWTGACALASCALPVVLIQVGVPYVDVFYGAFCLAAAAAWVLYDRSGKTLWLLAWAAAFGMALGTKSTAYLQIPLFFLPFWTLRMRPDLRRRAFTTAPILAVLVLLLGATSYLDNLRQTGNPIYPFIIRLPFYGELPGILKPTDLLVAMEKWLVPSPVHWFWYPFRETFKGEVNYSVETGFGPLFAAGWALFPLALWRAARRRDRAALGALLLFPATVAAFFLLQPARVPRYAIFLAPLLIVSLAALFRRLRGGLRTAALCVWGLGSACAVLGGLGSLGTDIGVRHAWQVLRREGAVDPLDYYRLRFGALAQAWSALNPLLKPGDVVAVSYGELVFPWAGLPPRARVEFVSHRVNPYPGAYGAESDEEWLDVLDNLGTRYLGVWTPSWYPEEGNLEKASAARHPERFVTLGEWESGGIGKVVLYALRPRPLTSN